MIKLKKHFSSKKLLEERVKLLQEDIVNHNDKLLMKEMDFRENGNIMYVSLYYLLGSEMVEYRTEEGTYYESEPLYENVVFNSDSLTLNAEIEELKCRLEEESKNHIWDTYNKELFEKICSSIEYAIEVFKNTGVILENIVDEKNEMVFGIKAYTTEDQISEMKDKIKAIEAEISNLKKDISTIETVEGIKNPMSSRYFSGDVFKLENEMQVNELLRMYSKCEDMSVDGELDRNDLKIPSNPEFPLYVFFEFVKNNPFAVDTDERNVIDGSEILKLALGDLEEASKEIEVIKEMVG